MTSDDQTLGIYEAKAADYADMISDDRPDPYLDAFLEMLPDGAKLLDLGCARAITLRTCAIRVF